MSKLPKAFCIATKFEYGIEEVLERFNKGEVGKIFEMYMQSDKIAFIFAGCLVVPLKEMVRHIKDENHRECAEILIDQKLLFFNFYLNVANTIFNEAVNRWLKGEENLDKIIIKLIQEDFAKEVAIILYKGFEEVLNNEETVREICHKILEDIEQQEEEEFDAEKLFHDIVSLYGDKHQDDE